MTRNICVYICASSVYPGEFVFVSKSYTSVGVVLHPSGGREEAQISRESYARVLQRILQQEYTLCQIHLHVVRCYYFFRLLLADCAVTLCMYLKIG